MTPTAKTKNRLAELRRKAGLSQHALAERSGVSRPTIARIEGGEQDDTSASTALALAKALGTTVETLLGVG
jgi:transcriptional regulator with XRE-family HTH domain